MGLFSNISKWSDTAQATALGAGLSAGSGLIGGLFGMIGQRRQYKNQKKLMALQHQYDIDAFNREVQAQKDLSAYMAKNSNIWQKISMANAGYSTADPNGTGVQTAGVSAPDMNVPGTPTAPYVDYASPFQAISQSAMQMAEVGLMNSQQKLYEKQASRYDEYTDAQIAEIRQRANEEESRSELNFQQAESIRTMLPILKDKGNAEVEKIRNEASMFKKQEEKLAKDIDKIIQDIKVGKSQEALNYASAEKARSETALNKQLQSESDAREGLYRQQQETERERTNLTHEQAEQARYDAIWKQLEIVARQNGFDINDSQAKQQYTHMCWKLVNAKDENDVKRILKHSIGNLGYAADWLLQQAGSLITGVAVGAMASRGRGSKKTEAPAKSYDTKPPSPDPSVWY